MSNIKNWVYDFETKDNINSIIQKISFIQNIDPNDDDIKKIEDYLKSFITKNAELKSPMFWAAIIKNHFKKTNRLKDLKDFDERFMPSDQRDYNDSPLIFFDSLKEDNKKLDIKVDNLGTKVDNLDKRVLTLEVETKNLVISVNGVKTRLDRVETRLDKINDRINKSSDKYMLFFIHKVLDALKIERMKVSIKTIECIF